MSLTQEEQVNWHSPLLVFRSLAQVLDEEKNLKMYNCLVLGTITSP